MLRQKPNSLVRQTIKPPKKMYMKLPAVRGYPAFPLHLQHWTPSVPYTKMYPSRSSILQPKLTPMYLGGIPKMNNPYPTTQLDSMGLTSPAFSNQ